MPSSDVFRPRLPLDPFAVLDSPLPWRVQLDAHPPLSHIMLLLGAPSHADLAPLATSHHLAQSLLIIATHTPPPVPSSFNNHDGPSIIILHLPAPLDIHDSGAVRLVGVLDRAQRVAHAWRTATFPQPRLQQFAELYPGGEFSISEDPEIAVISTSPSRQSGLPTDDSLSLSSSTSCATSASPSTRSFHKPSSKSKNTGQPLFDAIINFLPSALPDKALLKHAILVTTLSTSFLAAPVTTPFSPYQRNQGSNKRQSIFSLSLSSLSNDRSHRPRKRLSSFFTSSTPPPSAFPHHSSSPASLSSCSPSSESLLYPKKNNSRPHLVHVLPYSTSSSATTSASSSRSTLIPHPSLPHRSATAPAQLSPSNLNSRRHSVGYSLGKGNDRTKLIQSIEQFLLSFAYPPQASVSSPASAHHHMAQSSPLPLPLSSLPPSPPSLSSSAPTSLRIPLRSSPLAGDIDAIDNIGKRRSSVLSSPASVYSPAYINNRKSSGSMLGGQNLGGMAMFGSQPYRPPPMPTTSLNGTAQPVPYLVPAGVLGAYPSESKHGNGSEVRAGFSIGELVLLGLLDGVATGGDMQSGKLGGRGESLGESAEGWPRVWIGASTDVEIVPTFSPTSRGTSGDEDEKRERTKEREAAKGPGIGSKGKGKVRRNEAGLPTPPESSSSLDGESTSEEDYHDQDQDEHRPPISNVSHPDAKRSPGLPPGNPRMSAAQVHGYHYQRQHYRDQAIPLFPSYVTSSSQPPTITGGTPKTKHGLKMRVSRFFGLDKGKVRGENTFQVAPRHVVA